MSDISRNQKLAFLSEQGWECVITSDSTVAVQRKTPTFPHRYQLVIVPILADAITSATDAAIDRAYSEVLADFHTEKRWR